MANRPAPEVEINSGLVRSLLGAQFPALADLPMQELSRGWDNTSFRLGDELIVRLPHRALAATLIEHEIRWLPELATRVELAVPAAVHIGRPEPERYPWSWAIVPWLPGHEAASATLVKPAVTAERLARFLSRLHQPAPADAPANASRGVPLANRRASFERFLPLSGLGAVERHGLAEVFEAACATPAGDERVWLHGDLHTRNMLVDRGALSAVIDWGDVCAGDRATDLAAAFMLVPDHVDVVRGEAGADDDAWRRAAGWAANFAAVYLANSDDEPVMASIGHRLTSTLLQHFRPY